MRNKALGFDVNIVANVLEISASRLVLYFSYRTGGNALTFTYIGAYKYTHVRMQAHMHTHTRTHTYGEDTVAIVIRLYTNTVNNRAAKNKPPSMDTNHQAISDRVK